MIVSCSKCDSKYSVDDSKVDGKRFGFVCPKCGENVEIDNRVREEAPEQLEEQLNEELFDENADLTTGEEDSGIGVDLPEDIDEDLDTAVEGDIAGIATEAEDILKEVDELGALGTDIDDDLDVDMQESDSESEEDGEDIGLSIEDFEGISELDSAAASEDISDEISSGTDEETEDSVDFDEMELPDLENLADISETGETADDAISIAELESPAQETAEPVIPEEDTSLGPDEPLFKEDEPLFKEDEPLFKEDELIEDFAFDEGESELDGESEDFEEIEMSIDTPEEPEELRTEGEEDSGLLEDFSPIEEDIEGISIEDASAPTVPDEEEEEEIELNMEDMVGLEDVESSDIFSGEEDTGVESEEEDEDITIDLDSLDIQLEEDDEEAGAPVDMEVEELSESEESLIADSLDIEDLGSDIIEDDLSGLSGETESAGFEEEAFAETEETASDEGEDEDITLDLESLDLTLDEVEELKEGEELDDEERISLSDAGLTPDELVEEKETAAMEESEEDTGDEDIRISVDEVAPDVDIDTKADEIDQLMDDIEFADIDHDELPEIDFDEFDKQDDVETLDIEPLPEDYEPSTAKSGKDFSEHEQELSSLDIDIRDTVPGGMINFSIDYSFTFSRLGAFFRLICLYPIILIPHFIVLLIYSVLSILLSVFNYLIVLFSGVHEEDFTSIQENTIRYFLSLAACAADVVEEVPEFAGRKNIDYPFQLDATYPVTRSRILAFLRLTVAGILIAALPHLIILLVLSVGSILIYLIGLLSIIFTKKWPKSLFDFMTRYYKYWANVLSFITGVIDRYPSFKFD